MQSPENLVDIYAALERIRLIASAPVVSAAERVMQEVLSAYNARNKTYDELLRVVMNDVISTYGFYPGVQGRTRRRLIALLTAPR